MISAQESEEENVFIKWLIFIDESTKIDTYQRPALVYKIVYHKSEYLKLLFLMNFWNFAYDPGDWSSIPGEIIPNTKKNGTWYLLA